MAQQHCSSEEDKARQLSLRVHEADIDAAVRERGGAIFGRRPKMTTGGFLTRSEAVPRLPSPLVSKFPVRLLCHNRFVN